MSIKNSIKLVLLVTTGFLAVQAQAAVITRDFAGNDCSGFFGQGFDACSIFVNSNGVKIELSPVIAKYDVNDLGAITATETNGTVFPSIDGSEFSFSGITSGSWSYAPGAGDPGVRYWVAKAGPKFKLFWEVSAADAAGVCNVADVYTFACLDAALLVSSGNWNTPGGKKLSHITFYDTGVVPVPAAVWLFVSGLLGLLGVARSKRS